MPANRTFVVDHRGEEILEFQVEGDLEPRRSVYFTDQEPCFEITVENVSDRRVEGYTILRTSYEESSSNYEPEESEKLEYGLDSGEKETFELCLEMLPYQGTAAVGFNPMRVRDQDDHWEVEKRASSRTNRVYTFMVYDRDYYRVNYLRPKYSQYVASGLAVLIVLIGVIRIGIFLAS